MSNWIELGKLLLNSRMRYKDISPTMRRFLGTWEGFRKLGFAADDIFCSVERSARLGGRLS